MPGTTEQRAQRLQVAVVTKVMFYWEQPFQPKLVLVDAIEDSVRI